MWNREGAIWNGQREGDWVRGEARGVKEVRQFAIFLACVQVTVGLAEQGRHYAPVNFLE